jgi:hypothetical protein
VDRSAGAAPTPYQDGATPSRATVTVAATVTPPVAGGSVIPAPAGALPIAVADDGSTLTTAVRSFNFVGDGVVAVANTQNNAVTVTITGGNVISNYSNANVAAYLPTNTSNVSGNYFIGNGSLLTGIVAVSNYSNSNVAAYLASGTASSNIITTANISGGYILGNGSQLTGISTSSYANSNVAAYLPTYTGNLVSLAGNVTTTGNISGNYFIGNGSQLTGISTSFDLEMHVSKNGNDSTGTGTILRPYLTITHALTQVTGGRNTIVIHPGGYTENPTITSLATQLITYDATGASTLVYGTVTIANTTGRIAGLKMTNLAITGNAQAYINSSTVDEQFTKSSSGYVEVDDCELQVTGNVLISGSGSISIVGNKINNLVVNNAGAAVLVKGADDCVMPQVTAGSLNIVDSIIRASSNTANAVTASAGTVVTLMNNQIVTPAADNVARVSIAGYHSIISLVYDKANSTLSNSLNSVAYFQTANVDSLVSSGNITGGNVLTGGLISATSTITSAANITGANLITAGNVYAPAIVNNGAYNTQIQLGAASGIVTITTDGNSTQFGPSGAITLGGASQVIGGTFGGSGITLGASQTDIFQLRDGNVTVQVGTGGATTSTWTFTNSGNLLAPGAVSAVGNVTGGNILTAGLISATGNVTSANTLNAAGLSLSGNVVSALTSAANITTTANITGGNLSVTGNVIGNIRFTGANITINNAPGGNEGAELFWALPAPANTVLSTSLVQDVFQNGMRFFESGGNTRGLYMDLGNAPNGSATAVGYRDIPQVSFSANATIAATDAGRHYYSVSASNLSLTIANNTSVAWPVGTAITIVNAGTASILINQGTGVSMYQAGNATAGNRVLATFGMATIMNTAANTWFINGTGLS